MYEQSSQLSFEQVLLFSCYRWEIEAKPGQPVWVSSLESGRAGFRLRFGLAVKLVPSSMSTSICWSERITDVQTPRKDGASKNFRGIQVGTLNRTRNKHLACSHVLIVGDICRFPDWDTSCVPHTDGNHVSRGLIVALVLLVFVLLFVGGLVFWFRKHR